jgi:hypothetical protein
VRIRSGVGTTVLVYAVPGRSAGPIATFQPTIADQTFPVQLSALTGTHTWYRVEVRSPGAVPAAPVNGRLGEFFLGRRVR